MLGLQKVDWEQGKARDGWLYHEFFGGIHLYHGGRDDAGVELSGAGCRMLETCNGNSFDWVALFSYIREQGDEMNPRPAPLSAVPHGTAAPQPYSYAPPPFLRLLVPPSRSGICGPKIAIPPL